MCTRRFLRVLLVVGILSLGPVAGRTFAGPVVSPEAEVSAAAATLSPEIVISALNNVKHLPAVAYNPNHDEYLVVWQNNWPSRDIYAQRISSRGQLLSWFTVTTGAGGDQHDRAQPSVAYDTIHDRYLVVFIHDVWGDGSDWDVGGRFIPWNGPSSSLTEFPICQWNSSQWNPVVRFGQSQQEFLVVWTNTPVGQPAYISGRRVFADGSGFPPGDGFTISSGAENRINPAVAYNLARNEYLVVWDQVGASHDIYGVRLRGDGVPLGTGAFGIAGWPDNEEQPAVAACRGADQYLVGWQSLVRPPIDYDIYARFVTGDGVPAGVYWVDGTTAPEEAVSIRCDLSGREYLIAWQKMYATGYYGIWARLAHPNETFEPCFGLVQPGSTADRTAPAIGGGRVNYLVAWEHQRDGTAYQDIHGRLVYPHAIYLPLARK
jgi:hypothetical protein